MGNQLVGELKGGNDIYFDTKNLLITNFETLEAHVAAHPPVASKW